GAGADLPDCSTRWQFGGGNCPGRAFRGRRVIICGIDVGAKGALGFINTDNGNAAWYDMPYRDKEVDVEALDQCIRWLCPDIIWVELVHSMPGQGVTSMFNFGRS